MAFQLQIELEYRIVGFEEGGKNGEHGGKNPRSKEESEQQTPPTYDAEFGNRTRATLVGGERLQDCSIRAPIFLVAVSSPHLC